MRNLYFSVWVLFVLAYIAEPCSAQELAQFDGDKDGRISDTELRAYVLHWIASQVKDVDSNHDGAISIPERDIYIGNFIRDVRKELTAAGTPYSFELIEELFPPKTEFNLFGMLLRESYEEVTISSIAAKYEKAMPATFSFARDVATNTNTWSAKGSIMWPIRLDVPKGGVNPGSAYLSGIAALPSITFNRVSTKDSTKEVDALQFRMGFDFEVAEGFLGIQDYRWFYTYATDFSFLSHVVALEAEWEPTDVRYGMGAFVPVLWGAASVRYRIYPHVQTGYVLDSGANAKLRNQEFFFRAGPKVALSIWPFGFQQLELTGKWSYLGGTGTPEHSRLWEASATYSFDNTGHYSLKAEYTKGIIPLVQQNTETVKVSFGLKF